MTDKETLKKRIVPLELYKLTPRNNCGECGQNTCLAFATQVVAGQVDIAACVWLDEGKARMLKERLKVQLSSGIGVSRHGFEKTMEFLREEIRKWDFRSIAVSLGAEIGKSNDEAALIFSYFGDRVLVTGSDVRKTSGSDVSQNEESGELSPWEKILIFNYVIGGATEPSGAWVGMESLPNSVSKIKSLQTHCEGPLSRLFNGRSEILTRTIVPWGREVRLKEQGVDFAVEFVVLPKLTIRVLFWEEVMDEGYPCRVKFLFDSRVLQVVDLESLIFACEQITVRLTAVLKQNR